MKQKRKDLAFDIFYNQYKVAEKYAYILKVVNSCVTFDQVHIVYEWGWQVLHDIYDNIYRMVYRKYGLWNGIDISMFINLRITDMQDDLKVQCNRRDHEIFSTPAATIEETEEKEEHEETPEEETEQQLKEELSWNSHFVM